MSMSIRIYVDGAVAGGERTGIAAVARTADGEFLGWASRCVERMTNNEAEYRAALLGLELASSLGLADVTIYSDSEVVVRQMQGRSRVNSAGLKSLHVATCRAVLEFARVTFRHIGRDDNRLADALATDALHGSLVRMGRAPDYGLKRILARFRNGSGEPNR